MIFTLMVVLLGIIVTELKTGLLVWGMFLPLRNEPDGWRKWSTVWASCGLTEPSQKQEAVQ